MLTSLACCLLAQQPIDLNTLAPLSSEEFGTEFNRIAESNGQLSVLARAYTAPGNGDLRRDLLMRTDGTPGGTTVIADFNLPGSTASSGSGGPSAALPNGDLVCTYTSQPTGREPYLIEATTGTVRLLADIVLGDVGSDPRAMVAFGGEVWILANEAESGFDLELWRTDGTAAGTQQVPTPVPVQFGAGLFVSDSALYLLIDEDNLLARTPGSTWSSIPVPAGLSLRSGFGVVNDRLVLSAVTAATGFEPWSADVATGSLTALGDLRPGSGNSVFYTQSAISGGQLLFRADTPGLGAEPWTTDGTPAGTQLLADTAFGPTDGYVGLLGSGIPGVGPIGVPGGFYFTAFQFSTGNELWFSDGTPGGTALVADLNPGPASSSPTRFLFDGDLFLGAVGGLPGSERELYRHVPGTTQFDLVAAVEPSYPLGVVGGALVYQRAGFPFGSLYRWDPLTMASLELADPSPEVLTQSSSPRAFERFDFRAVLSAKISGGGEKLYLADSAALSISSAFHTPGMPIFGEANYLGETPAGALFSESVLFSSEELYLGSTTGAPPAQLVSFPPTPVTRRLRGGGEIGGRVLFVSASLGTDAGLWSSDGTAAGTLQLAPIPNLSFDFLGAGQIARFQEQLWFELDTELWRSDGLSASPAGLGPMVTLPLGARVTTVNNRLLFLGDGSLPLSRGRVWSSDGTSGGTELLLELSPPTVSAEFVGFAEVGDRALFAWRNFDQGQEVWSTDGTVAGTQLLVDATPGTKGDILALTGDGVRAFFISEDPATRVRLLWASDGTPAGTVVASAGDPAVGGLVADELWSIGLGRVGFTGISSAEGIEPWGSDGTTTGPLVDLIRGPESSFSGEMLRVGDLLLVSALDPLLGREPFVASLAPGAPSADAVGVDCGARLSLAAGLPSTGSLSTFLVDVLDSGVPTALLSSGVLANLPLGGGCVQYVGNPNVLGLQFSDAGGRALFDVAVPNLPALVGRRVALQGLAPKPGGPLFGLFEVSQALEVVLGG